MIDPSSIRTDEFLLQWYGAGDAGQFRMPVAGQWLPAPLRHWYELTAGLAEPRGRVKRFLAPEDIRAEDGKAVFVTDATGDWRWAFDVEEPGVVYDGELYEQWHRNEEDLEQFLTHHAVQEAVHGARRLYWHTHVPESLVPAVVDGLEQIGFPQWRWPAEDDYRYFLGDLIVAEVVPDFGPPGHYQVHVASPDPHRLSYLDQLGAIDWQRAGE
ncbi:hypothetical protein [Actinoplanes sp. URMC 104]|uniref:hypothetical protein n=1 Tax=Actinoplanes sp. URMC 104 TaxID=3423409 RepID=UPI003F1B0903